MQLKYNSKDQWWEIHKPTPTARGILLLLFDQRLEFSAAEIAEEVGFHVQTVRSTANFLSAHTPSFISKRKGRGGAPRHPDLRNGRGGPVTWSNVHHYMKQQGIPYSEQRITDIRQELWEEAAALGNWIPLRPNLYSASPEFQVQREEHSLLLVARIL